MADIIYQAGAPSLLSIDASQDFGFSVTENPGPGNMSPVTINKPGYSYVITRDFPGEVLTFDLTATPVSPGGPPVSVYSDTPDVCTINAAGEVGHVTDGMCAIVMRSRYGERVLKRLLTTFGSQEFGNIISYAQGSLANETYNLLLSYFDGVTVANAESKLKLHGGVNDSLPNPNRIAQEIDMSWQSVVSSAGSAFPVALISPRHVIGAAHVMELGRSYTFRRPDNTLIVATVQAVREPGPGLADMMVAQLDIAVTGCAFGRFSSDVYNKGDFGNIFFQMPCIVTPQNSFLDNGLGAGRKFMAVAAAGVTDGVVKRAPMGLVQYGPSGSNSENSLRANDSGSTMFIPIKETPGSAPVCLLWTSLYYPLIGPEYNTPTAIQAINAAMNTLAGTAPGTYAVSTADLSRFTSYT